MSYRTILVVLDSEESTEELLTTASLLAEQHSSHLIGLYVVPPLEVYVTSDLPIPAEFTASYAAEQRKRIEAMKSLFVEKTQGQRFAAEWRVIDNPNASRLSATLEISNTVDLVVMSQKDCANTDSTSRDFPERILMAGGRPVVIVPRGLNAPTIGKFVYAAWDGHRESSRALFDAIPVMLMADSVYLHRINSGHDDDHCLVGITEELAKSLSRHDVKIEVSHSKEKSRDVGEALLQGARDRGADLIVMGAYGHSRVQEFLLGGTTRKILDDMHTHVFMSH